MRETHLKPVYDICRLQTEEFVTHYIVFALPLLTANRKLQTNLSANDYYNLLLDYNNSIIIYYYY